MLFTDRMSAVGAAETEVLVGRAVAAGEEFDGQLEIVSGPTAGRWVRWRGQASASLPSILHGVSFDVTDQRHADAARRDGEQRQAFLLALSDALRPLSDPEEVQRVATSRLGRHLGASRVFYVVVEADGDMGIIHRDDTDSVPSRTGRYSLSSFSTDALAAWHAGRIASTDDVDADPRYSAAERAAYATVSTRAGVGVPLIKQGRLTAPLGINRSTPRRWTEAELGLASEVADRAWPAVERSRAEAALFASEEKYRTVFESIDEGMPRSISSPTATAASSTGAFSSSTGPSRGRPAWPTSPAVSSARSCPISSRTGPRTTPSSSRAAGRCASKNMPGRSTWRRSAAAAQR